MPLGKFGRYGGQYAPETLMPALKELEDAFKQYSRDSGFKKELNHLLQRRLVELKRDFTSQRTCQVSTG